jgi:integrase/recombinase XerD
MSLLNRFLAGKKVGEVTTEDLEAWARSLKVSRGTLRTYLSCVNRYFARLELLVPPSVPLPRKAARPMGRVLSKAEIAALLEGCDVRRHAGLRNRALLELLYSTGLRASEVRRLRREDVDLEAGLVTVRNGKGGKDRVVPLTTSAVAWLERYLRIRREHEILFLSRWGKPFGEVGFQQILRRLGVTCHVLRRTMATHLLEGGASPADVAGILGHVGLETLSRYARVGSKAVKAAHTRFHPREKDDV